MTWPQPVSTLSMPVGGSENWEDGAGGDDASRPEEVGMSMMTTTRTSRRQNFAELRRAGEAGAVYQPWQRIKSSLHNWQKKRTEILFVPICVFSYVHMSLHEALVTNLYG